MPRISGVLNGSKRLELPQYQAEIETYQTFVAGGAPVCLEVGFDHGRRLQSTARLNPDWRVVGLEIRKARVLEARRRAQRDGLRNLLAWRADARAVFAGVIEPASLHVIDILFPTPWFSKSAKYKRLLLTPMFLADLARALKPSGLVHFATDVEQYAGHAMDMVSQQTSLAAVSQETARDLLPTCHQLSRREWTCQQRQIPIFRRFFQRIITE